MKPNSFQDKKFPAEKWPSESPALLWASSHYLMWARLGKNRSFSACHRGQMRVWPEHAACQQAVWHVWVTGGCPRLWPQEEKPHTMLSKHLCGPDWEIIEAFLLVRDQMRVWPEHAACQQAVWHVWMTGGCPRLWPQEEKPHTMLSKHLRGPDWEKIEAFLLVTGAR